jgi:hypothetical protein
VQGVLVEHELRSLNRLADFGRGRGVRIRTLKREINVGERGAPLSCREWIDESRAARAISGALLMKRWI